MSEGCSLLQVRSFLLVQVYAIVQEPGGWSSLLVGVGERAKVVTFCRWVPTYWYESTLVQDCKTFFLYIKHKSETKSASGFFPHWFSTLNPGVHVCSLCVILYSVLIAPAYYL